MTALPDPLYESDMKGEITEHETDVHLVSVIKTNWHRQNLNTGIYGQCPNNIGAVWIIRICCCKDEICFYLLCFIIFCKQAIEFEFFSRCVQIS